MKTILFLDANETVINAINYAKKIGCRVVTCDNIPENIGHKYADKSYNISTYDIESLKRIVTNEHIDGIVYLASAHGLYGGTKLNELFNFPGIPYRIEKLFSNKGNFRKLLQQLNIPNPHFRIYQTNDPIDYNINYPCIVKPVDSSGGNIGITKVEEANQLKEAIEFAIENSFSHEALVEDFIESDLQLNGDCLIINGEIYYLFIGQYLYSPINPILPIATIFGPDLLSPQLTNEIRNRIKKIIASTHITNGILNMELRVDKKGEIFFVEINPRHSGNRIYQLMHNAYNTSLEEINVNIAIGETDNITPQYDFKGYYAYCIIYSNKKGILQDIEISPLLKSHIINSYFFKKNGDSINEFKLLRDRVGLLLLKFDTKEQMDSIMLNINNYYQIKVYENK